MQSTSASSSSSLSPLADKGGGVTLADRHSGLRRCDFSSTQVFSKGGNEEDEDEDEDEEVYSNPSLSIYIYSDIHMHIGVLIYIYTNAHTHT